MRMEMGLAQFWAQGDAVTHFVAILLLGLSLASWYVMAGKIHGVWQARRCHLRAQNAFWGAESLPAAIEAIRSEDKTGILAGLAIAGANAAELHRQHAARGIGAGVSASEFVTRAVRSQIVESQAKIESGLTFLASVGSTAPFIGLFGTVIGVLIAFEKLGEKKDQAAQAAQAAQAYAPEAVMSSISEALVATAVGLAVAIPAVAFNNYFQRIIKSTLANTEVLTRVLLAHLKSTPLPAAAAVEAEDEAPRPAPKKVSNKKASKSADEE